MPFSNQMDAQMVVYSHREILYGNENEQSIRARNITNTILRKKIQAPKSSYCIFPLYTVHKMKNKCMVLDARKKVMFGGW